MPRATRRSSAPAILLAAAGYVLVGVVTAALARGAPSLAAVKGWRAAAWLLSLSVFVSHVLAERRRGAQRGRVAMHVALAVALGAFGLAALGPVRSHWGEPGLVGLAVLSLVAWPILTGIPALVVALAGGALLDRLPAVRRSARRATGGGWVAIAHYAAGYEADLAIARLAAAGIPAVRRGNDTVGLFGPGFEGPTARGVDVLVPLAVMGAAREVLEEEEDSSQ